MTLATLEVPGGADAVVESGSAGSAQGASEGRARRENVVEFLLTGGASILLLPLAWLLRKGLGLEDAELLVGFLTFHAAAVINDPHFSVTYLLFYRNLKARAFGSALGPRLRVRYWIAGAVVPALLIGWAAFGLGGLSVEALGLLFELMFLLVGWHYVKQGFGVLTVLSARRGVRFSELERRVLLAHCYTGWGFAWANPAHPASEVAEQGVAYLSLPRPAALELASGVLLALTTLALGAVLLRKWRREGRAAPWVPLSGFLASVWLWLIGSNLDPLLVYLIPALHSIQYLYFVWLLKRNEACELSGPPSFQGTVAGRLAPFTLLALALGWLFFGGIPNALDASLVLADPGAPDGALGATPFLAAIATAVNIHHYFMDHVIWRRDNPETRYLFADVKL